MAEKRDFTGFDVWLRQRRLERGWKQQTAADKLFELTGVRVRREWLSQLENGDRPGEDLARAFERLYGDFEPGKVVTWTIKDEDVLGFAVVGLVQQVKDLLRRVEELEAHLGIASVSTVEPVVPVVRGEGEYEVDLASVAAGAAALARRHQPVEAEGPRPAEAGHRAPRRTPS